MTTNTEKLYQQLAQTLETGDYAKISEFILHLASNQRDLSIAHIDHFNIPLLITENAHKNSEAQWLLASLHQAKMELFEEEKPKILEDFESGLKRRFDGLIVPGCALTFLSLMALSEDTDYARIGFRLLEEMDFEDEDLIDVYRLAYRNRERFPEAQKLVEKIQKIERDFEDSDDEEEDDANESFLSEASDVSTDSGFDGESEEILLEEEETFDAALAEIFMQIFKESLRSGVQEEIQAIIDILDEFQLPMNIDLYRKHEISRLIVEFAAHNDDALELFEALEQRKFI